MEIEQHMSNTHYESRYNWIMNIFDADDFSKPVPTTQADIDFFTEEVCGVQKISVSAEFQLTDEAFEYPDNILDLTPSLKP